MDYINLIPLAGVIALIFVFIKNYIRNKVELLVKQEKEKKLK